MISSAVPIDRRLSRESFAPLFEHLARGSVIYALPLVMTMANRSGLASICFAAGSCIVALLLRTGSPVETVRALIPARSPVFTLTLILALLAAISLTWTADLRESVFGYGEALLALGCAGIVAKGLAPHPRSLLLRHLCIALFIAAVIIAIELVFGMPGRHFFHVRLETPQYNRALEIAVVMATLLVAAGGRESNTLVWLTLAVLAGVTLASESGAAIIALLAAALTAIVARVNVAATRRLGLAVVLLALALAPFLGAVDDLLAMKRMASAIEGAHASERIAIWRAYDHVVSYYAAIGTGFNSSSAVTGFLTNAPPDLRALIAAHPHNAFLQVWVELGAAGALLVGLLVWVVFDRIAGQPYERQIESLILFATAGVIAMVSHSAWQGVWIAAVGGTMALSSLYWRSPP